MNFGAPPKHHNQQQQQQHQHQHQHQREDKVTVQQQQQSSSVPERVHLQTPHDAAIATLKQANVLNAILVLINDGNSQPPWQLRSAIGHNPSDIDSLRSVREELKGLKKLSKLLIRPYMKHNVAGIPNVNIKTQFSVWI
jgi:hypothetical protein